MTLASKILCIAAYAALAAASPDQTVRAPAPKVCSSMRYNEESGDLLGMEVAITRAAGGALCVSYQLSEGQPEPVWILPAVLRGDTLVFTIPPDSGHVVNGNSQNRGPLVEIVPVRVFHGLLSTRGLRVPAYRGVPEEWMPRRRVAYFPSSVKYLLKVASQKTCSPTRRSRVTGSSEPTRTLDTIK